MFHDGIMVNARPKWFYRFLSAEFGKSRLDGWYSVAGNYFRFPGCPCKMLDA